MKCPNCGAEMAPDDFGVVDGAALVACVPCKVAVSAPPHVLASLSRRLSPEGVMDEAERLLREAFGPGVDVYLWPEGNCDLDSCRGGALAVKWERAPTLSEAYAKLKGGSDG